MHKLADMNFNIGPQSNRVLITVPYMTTLTSFNRLWSSVFLRIIIFVSESMLLSIAAITLFLVRPQIILCATAPASFASP